MNRRSFLRTAAGLLVAPWVVKAENLMPVRPLIWTPDDDGWIHVALVRKSGTLRRYVNGVEILGGQPTFDRLTAPMKSAAEGHLDGPVWTLDGWQNGQVALGTRVTTIDRMANDR